ncbi:NAD-dependent epimerase/dehydratase [Geobacter metallireducens RCH3]|uniref:NAD-dependent nucleoside diphosphate-sugar epimerase/dehydratase n=1 Tax=Geobacter metallireducens (strain ATCC 53774 / DSM 7210 / GS-15) TaxID=269799 RepID=Q39W04_GEOMG|nr:MULTISPECIES: SDR family oxidoreductase [Geobacter]ABB31570.1 NAD-dependent nucleoside diphosphate-sugar epimerase/dehydratase [Geobacter metallireducens GS-15]EHP86668.1 NAD-dependent epimerase/dehydratase [Geobacter metallireducens RCH3]MBT1075483.1 SDR family oxidoreductase [Geobacter grbiciae]
MQPNTYFLHNILVTGATGFVGSFLCSRLLAEGMSVRGTFLVTENPDSLVKGTEQALIEPIGPATFWGHALAGAGTVIHLAARVHVMRERAADPLKEFRFVNTEGTAHLAREAAKAGVKRFVFMGTIGVNGDNSGDAPYIESSPPYPHNPYSVSKYEAEQLLRQISSETGMEVVIIRAPLVYGPGNPGNFLSLLKAVNGDYGFKTLNFGLKVLPLPLASINNKRSLIYVGNLVDALVTCATHPAAVGQTYLVSDGEDVSTPELIRRTAAALGVPARLFPFPVPLMKLAGKLIDKSAAVNRLTGSLTVDSSKIRRELGWQPPFTMEEGLQETAKWFEKQG